MTRSWTAAALLAALILAHLPAPVRADPALSPAERKSLPAEVVTYLDRHMGCNHWSGEEAYDAARGRQIAAAVKTLRCDAIEADAKRLRQRYGRDPAVRKALDAAAHAEG
ncbi:conserved protein of unknown function; putative exported protein [Methylorubrum extorquens]|uniref:Uncharacterized protein n=1 Tax=Methylorubrum extorquens TaxID=408 RepID=A0A2N9AVJ4_METEX|nr:hypothetical protein [Methylorubrum zatmanii]ARO55157.1 hypothetical protein B2G69_14205 [Methylorubrum zatmanii]KQQ06680.1 hypothetical protein ASF59_23620 [Methylobacterium sp. Leaf121]SOR31308.1 conserved protein of unknown function; putative exported protein [Methylorubrum extorquens]